MRRFAVRILLALAALMPAVLYAQHTMSKSAAPKPAAVDRLKSCSWKKRPSTIGG